MTVMLTLILTLMSCAAPEPVDGCTEAWELVCEMCPDVAATMVECDDLPTGCDDSDMTPVEFAVGACSLPATLYLGA